MALGLTAAGLLAGCSTLKGAPDAVMNLVGPSTQSQVVGRYVDTTDVRQYYKLDAQRLNTQRLSYDGLSIPAGETRVNNLVDIPTLQVYLQGIVHRLAKAWPGEAPQFRVRLVDSYTFGPSADPYGNVFITLGTLENAGSEDEIAAMLGHEMSHVLLHHHDRMAAFQQQKDLMVKTATAVMLGTLAADTKVDRSSGNMKFISKDPKRTGGLISKTLIYTSLINSFSDNVWSTAWARTQEDQADLLGTDLMIRAGYAPRAASYSLQRLNDYQGKQAPLMTSFLDARQKAMKQSLEQFNINSFTQELSVLVNDGLTTSIQATTDYFKRAHMSALDRDEQLRHYMQREYRKERRTPVDTRSWVQVRASTPVKAALQGYWNAYQVTVALAQGDLKQADAYNHRALSSPVKDQPGVRRAAFNLHLAQGDKQQALKDLKSVKDWSLAGPDMYELMINYQLSQREPALALALISQAEQNLASQELFITEKVIANQQLKNEQQVQALLRQCEQYPVRKKSCEKLGPVKV
ncbi:M48 family metalloprotease [Pseudomonas sp. C2L11]|nr:M48 family metalloprotease [Pseudomonas typographi]